MKYKIKNSDGSYSQPTDKTFYEIPISTDCSPMIQYHHIAYTMSMPYPSNIKEILSSLTHPRANLQA